MALEALRRNRMLTAKKERLDELNSSQSVTAQKSEVYFQQQNHNW